MVIISLISFNSFKRIFCKHKEIYSFRRYDDFDFHEFHQCKECGKVLGHIKGFDEDIRG